MRNFKKYLFLFMFLLSLFVLIGCGEKPTILSIKVVSEMYVGDFCALDAEISAGELSNVQWSVDNPEVAKIENNKVIALKVGSFKLTATIEDSTLSHDIKVIEKKVYNISYELNGGSEDENNPLVKDYNSDLGEVTLTEPLREGYKFIGYYDNKELSGEKVTKIVNLESNLLLYASWEAIGFKITYELNGGSEDENNPLVKDYNSDLGEVALTEPLKEGYTFNGYYNNKELTGEKVTKVVNLDNDLLLYASWKATEYQINYELNGGTTKVDLPKVRTVEDEKYVLPNAEKDGYTFEGWYSNPEFTGEAVEYLDASNLYIETLYAKFTNCQFTISYDLDGGKWEAEEGKEEFETDEEVVLLSPVKDGYKFVGWMDETEDFVTEIENKNYVLQAIWDVIEYTISFKVDGIELPEKSINYTIEDEVELPILVDDNADFNGWYLTENYSDEKISILPKGKFGDVVLYGFWAEKTYKVNYVLDGGTYNTEVNTMKVGETIELGTPEKDNYTFLGWKLFLNANTFVESVTCDGEDIYVYAVFGNEGIYVGENLTYKTIESAVAAAENGNTIVVMPGVYDGAVINKSLTVKGYHTETILVNENVLQDTEITGDLVVAANDVTITGLVFKGAGRIISNSGMSISNTTIKKVVFRSLTLNVSNNNKNAPIYFVSKSGFEATNLTIVNCRIENDPTISGDRPMIAILSNVNNLTIKDNEFIGRLVNYNDGIKVLRASDEALDKSSYGVKGNVTITGNIFENYQQYTIWFREYGAGNYVIENNIFKNTGITADSHAIATFIKSNAGNESVNISVKYNTLENCIFLFRADTATLTNSKIDLNYNKLINCTGSVYLKNATNVEINLDNNYWGTGSPEAKKFPGSKVPANYYKSENEVPIMGKLENLKYNITYNLGDGTWDKDEYSYDEIIADLLVDLSAWYGVNVTASEVHNISENAKVNLYDFFLTDANYGTKWKWLSDFLIETRSNDLIQSSGASYLKDKSQGVECNRYWRYEVWAFLNKTTRETWPYSSKYNDLEVQESLRKAALPFAIEKPGASTYVTGEGSTLANALCPGRVFLYWISQDGVILKGKIPFNIQGDLHLTAVFQDEVKPTSFKVNNIPEDGIQRYETLQLEWTFNPLDTYNQALQFESSNPNIFTVDKYGLITAVAEGTATLRVKVLGNTKLNKQYTIKVYVPGQFKLQYETESYVAIGENIKLLASYVGLGATDKLVWSSSNDAIATVNNEGVVLGVSAGLATIKVALAENPSIYAEFGVTILPSELSDMIKFILASHESNVFVEYDLGIGSGTPEYYEDIIGSVNKILFNSGLTINETYLEKGNNKWNYDRTMESIEFITVHYTGNMSKGADADANASYFVGTGHTTAIHYTTGNDGVFHCMDDDQRAAHAGDSGSVEGYDSDTIDPLTNKAWTGVGKFEWLSTGVTAPQNVTAHDLLAIQVTVSDDCYYVINGQKTNIKLPATYKYKGRNVAHTYNDKGQVVNASDGSVKDAENYFSDMGFRFIVEDGEYKMGKTWWCYTQVWDGKICTTGGNYNSIGIESCVNEGSDLWYTWQKTAQLVAKLMKDNNLDINRVVGHHFYTAKDCPQPMLENNMEIWYEFIELVEAEYELLTKYNDYTINFEVINGSDNLDENGRTNMTVESSIVTYKVTITKDGKSESITLSSAIPGSYLK